MGTPELNNKLPKKGTVYLKAKKGKVLPVVLDGKIQRIVADKNMQVALELAPYETIIMFKRALEAKDIELIDMKKYVEAKAKNMDKPGSQKSDPKNKKKSDKKSESNGGK